MTNTQVREKPILFSGEMVRAILEGRKTQTRRPVKQNVVTSALVYGVMHGTPGFDLTRCPFGVPGDRLWVRETFAAGKLNACGSRFDTHPSMRKRGKFGVGYRASWEDGGAPWWTKRWRPSIHMPRWACRLALRVTDVRVERVQEITPQDIESEGVRVPCRDVGDGKGAPLLDVSSDPCPADYMPEDEDAWRFPDYQIAYWAALWDAIYAKRGFGWDANPWVWVVSFERETS